MDSIIMGLNIMLIVLVVIIIGLIVAYYFLVYKSKVNTEERDKAKEIKKQPTKNLMEYLEKLQIRY